MLRSSILSLQQYFDENRKLYEELSYSSSFEEVVFKTTIYGKKWCRWDWAFFFMVLGKNISKEKDQKRFLFDDLIQHLDSDSQCDKILTDKQIVLSIIGIIDGEVFDEITNVGLLNLLSHLFQKFPNMWKLGWMHTRTMFHRKWKKYHRLAFLTKCLFSDFPKQTKKRFSLGDFSFFSSDIAMQKFIQEFKVVDDIDGDKYRQI